MMGPAGRPRRRAAGRSGVAREGRWGGGGELVLGAGGDGAIRRHGRETYPNECCGALVGREGRVERAVGLANTTEEGPRRRFLVRPADYREAATAGGARG